MCDASTRDCSEPTRDEAGLTRSLRNSPVGADCDSVGPSNCPSAHLDRRPSPCRDSAPSGGDAGFDAQIALEDVLAFEFGGCTREHDAPVVEQVDPMSHSEGPVDVLLDEEQ